MKDEWREKLANRLTSIQLYQLTPKTNCGQCGFAACLAFATQAIVGQTSPDGCPYLDKEALAPFRARLEAQHQAGIGVKREGFEKALAYLRGRLKECNFDRLADSLGASFALADGEQLLEMPYFGQTIIVSKEMIKDSVGAELNPWEKIFLYNYIIDGAGRPSGSWVGMESLPNSVSKIKSLKAHCEDRLAKAFGANLQTLPAAVKGLGEDITTSLKQADFAAAFQILPKLTIRVLWWADEPAEGFAGQVKFLFDSKVLGTLDLESLLFACEQLTERLLEKVDECNDSG